MFVIQQFSNVCFCYATVPKRLEYIIVSSKSEVIPDASISGPPSKKPKIEQSADKKNSFHHTLDEVEKASLWLDSLIHQ